MSDQAHVHEVVIVGGGVAAMEATLALHHYAGERVHITVLSPDAEFTYRPARVREPFGHALAPSYPVEEILTDTGADHRCDAAERVDATRQEVQTKQGASISYDALVIATGARTHAPFRNAVTLDPDQLDEQLHGLVQDIEGSWLKSVAFVIPAFPAWPLPAYELVLMIARQAHEMQVDLKTTVITPELSPLAIFGAQASATVAQLLTEHGVDVVSARHCAVTDDRRITLLPSGQTVMAGQVLVLPELHGLAVPGIPCNPIDGFVAVDDHSRVVGLERVYAAGDLTNFPIKQGGVAAQQADVAAQSIAALAGAMVNPGPLRAELNGILWGAPAPLYLHARLSGTQATESIASATPLRDHAAKIQARFLAPRLEALDHKPESPS